MNDESPSTSDSGRRSWLKYDGQRMAVAEFSIIAWSVLTVVLFLSLAAPPDLRMAVAPLLLFFHIPTAIVSLIATIYGAFAWRSSAQRPRWFIASAVILFGSLCLVLPFVLYRVSQSATG
jgi:hypothetical protein